MRIFQLCGTASVNGFFGCGNFRTRGKIFILLRVTFIGQQKIRDILNLFQDLFLIFVVRLPALWHIPYQQGYAARRRQQQNKQARQIRRGQTKQFKIKVYRRPCKKKTEQLKGYAHII